MTSLAEKEREIEIVRDQLHLLVEQKHGNFSDEDVAKMSIYLDKLIVEYELASARRFKRS
ncbi:aspartyl-phosphate phosphatase Spo0E family protein [Sporomusa sp.]|uniref:aspartyl-phosphate phosphatase Spo0E family protein n=1 Tax=Sporomusa sp. TaxID=2078658 RepID=UPI002C881BA3|nr:aspartyl-phosphate phosphatase Spo0E family protein [Sporomusa sp.]HWR42747.1 aspartyl-phosphate phosphatase Spo0E family protein [Sporomusa sp.]